MPFTGAQVKEKMHMCSIGVHYALRYGFVRRCRTGLEAGPSPGARTYRTRSDPVPRRGWISSSMGASEGECRIESADGVPKKTGGRRPSEGFGIPRGGGPFVFSWSGFSCKERRGKHKFGTRPGLVTARPFWESRGRRGSHGLGPGHVARSREPAPAGPFLPTSSGVRADSRGTSLAFVLKGDLLGGLDHGHLRPE
jgi:hypothetical protein